MTSMKSGTTENEVRSDQSLTGLTPQISSCLSPTQNVTNAQRTNNSLSKPWGLKFWDSQEWETINGRLDYLQRLGRSFSPSRDLLFRSLETTQLADGGVNVRVVIVGQDPYPNPKIATGRAFEAPASVEPKSFPPTLKSIFSEYCSDLSLPYPTMGDLSKWVDQGVLLWNAIPSTNAGESLSHDWREYDCLTIEVLSLLDRRGVVFAFLGAVPRRYVGYVKSAGSRVIECSHPSPRGSLNSRNPFRGSRLFSTINQKLREIGEEPINWKL